MLISRGRRHGSGGALLLLDLDGFKQINDNHGHEAGDQVLIEVARRLHDCTRTEDVAARLGGDEFVVLIDLPEADADSVRERVQRLADKLVSQVSQPVLWHGQRLSVGASIGVRLLGQAGLDAEQVLAQADAALYRAKRSGRGQLVFHDGDEG
jgi:diguanylate cyclase (GGDEF)-like protein